MKSVTVAGHGGDRRSGEYKNKIDNINLDNAAPDGTSVAYALRKLRTDAPELHERVIAGDRKPPAIMQGA